MHDVSPTPDQPIDPGHNFVPGASPDTGATRQQSKFAEYERKAEQGRVSLSISDDGIARVSLGSELDKVVTFSPERLESLKQVVSTLETLAITGRVKGVVITSDHPKMFCAGADLDAVASSPDKTGIYNLIREGQKIFSSIRTLPVNTVAAVNGVCMGGALELALNCDAIIAARDGGTKFAFPEVELGILPGWTGTQITPRKIGLPAALKLMLGGRKAGLDAEKAAKIGLIEGLSNLGNLDADAHNLANGSFAIRRRELSAQDSFLTHTAAGRLLALRGVPPLPINKKFRDGAYDALRKKGIREDHYPAPFKIIESAVHGLKYGLEEGIRNEALLEAELGSSPQCKSFINIHFAAEGAKRLGKGADLKLSDQNSLVIGAGVMGAGIGAVLAKAGSEVSLKDPSEEQLARAKDVVAKTIGYSRSLSADQKKQILDGVEYSSAPEMSGKSLVIEVVPEIMDLKKRILGELSEQVSDDAIIATNTSSLSITEMAKAIKNPERFAGLHFFNPPEKMPLVEIIPGEKTSQETIDKLAAVVVQMGKIPVLAADVPGFLVNRTLMPYLNEAGFLLREGNSIEQIDKAAEDFGMPMGPLRLLDKIGLDTAEHVGKVIHAGYKDRMRAPESFEDLLEAGMLGEKSGEGFYKYSGKKRAPSTNTEALLHQENVSSTSPDTMQKRLIFSMINEAVRCLDEGVAVNSGKEGGTQIDVASVMGFGFAPFRGGLIHYAEQLGAREVLSQLEHLQALGERFEPAPGIVERAKRGQSFYEPVALQN